MSATTANLHDGNSYYGRPILKPHIWKPYIGWYFFAGGLAGGSSLLGLAARARGNGVLARNCSLLALAGVGVSPGLLIADLGRPARFVNMLRVFKPTSPMSVGSWLLAATGAADTAAATCELLDILPGVRRSAETTSALLAPALCTYTAVLLADTSVPVWHAARKELPFVFAGGAAASAGAAATIVTAPEHAGAARRLTLLGSGLGLAATAVMERRLGSLAEPYRQGRSGHLGHAAKALLGTGAALVALGGRRHARVSRLGAALALAGSACDRLSILEAGRQSAEDPAATVEPQRQHLEARRFGGSGEGHRAGMADTTNTDPSEHHPAPAPPERGRQEAGQREQGVRTEHSSDLSSPQVTIPADDGRGEQEGGARQR
jgi:formate-dependent nitrite reductase membrane component NrfD